MANGTIVNAGGRGTLSIPREIVNQQQGSGSGSGNSTGAVFGSLLDSKGMQKYLPKIELITFYGKEPKVWVRKCIKCFELYKVPNAEKVGIASLFLVDRANAWYHNWIKSRGPHS